MTILLLLIPLSLVLLGVAAWAFAWAVRGGQFDDLDTPAIEILHDECKVLDSETHETPTPTSTTTAAPHAD